MKRNGILEENDVMNVEFGRSVKRLSNLKKSIKNAKCSKDLFCAIRGLPLCDIVNDSDVVSEFRKKVNEFKIDYDTVNSWFEYLP